MKHNRSAELLRAAALPFAFLCAATILCALSFAGPAAAAAPDSTRAAAKAQPALWAQAVKIFAANKDLVPGTVRQKIQELEDDGRVKSESNAEISLSLDSEGKIKSDIVKAAKDGKDVTAEERKKAAEREKKSKKDSKSDPDDGESKERSHSVSSSDNPFNPDIQNDVRVTETNARETVGGRSCVRFGYSHPVPSEKPSKDKPTLFKGTAWIEESSGNPVKIEYTNDPLPKGAKSMLTTFYYGNGANGSWVVEKMEFAAHGSFLFFKKRIRGDITLGDYWKYVEPAPEK